MIARNIRVFPDLPIAGIQSSKEAVFTTLDYEFAEYVIHVENVFAWRDVETGEEYIPGDLAITIDNEVQRFAKLITEYRKQQGAQQANVREFSFRLPASLISELSA